MNRAIVVLLSLFILSFGGNALYATSVGNFAPPKSGRTTSVKHKSSRPKAGVRVKTLPRSRVHFTFRGLPYYFFEGVVYIMTNNEYQVAELAKGMVIPSLPEGELRTLILDDKIYYENCDVIYQAVETTDGKRYEVVGWLE